MQLLVRMVAGESMHICCLSVLYFILSQHRAFWAYHDKFPSQGRRLLDSLDAQTQKHLNDEKASMHKGSHVGLVHA